MSYHIYHTPAIILGSRATGEGDRMLFCYTRELGLVTVHAKSLRESRSRLRYALQTFAEAEIDLIRGKHGWKLTSARPLRSWSHVWAHGGKRRIVAYQMSLIRRLIQGEEQQTALFDDLLFGIFALAESSEEEEFAPIELLWVVRLLSHLGYLGVEETHPLLASPDAWSAFGLLYVESHRRELLALVNHALRETQL